MEKMTLNIARLIECREKKGYSKNEAAKQIGVSQPAYLRYESGQRTPSIQVVKEIARAFDTTYDYLTGNSDVSENNTYVIHRDEQPELYSFIEQYYRSDQEQRARLLAYFKRLS